MPGFDRSGPMGQGAMSGGGRGLCGSTDTRRVTENEGVYWGRGPSFRRGAGGNRGRGGGRGFAVSQGGQAPAAVGQPSAEKETFENQLDQLQQTLTRMQQRLDELENQR